MKSIWGSTAGFVSTAAIMGIAGCASTPVPNAKIASIASSEGAIRPAQETGSPADQKTRDLANVALRKAELAVANAANAQAQGIKGQAEYEAKDEYEAKETTKGQLAQARWQLASAGSRLGRREQQLAAEWKESVEAEKRAKDAMDRLAATVGTVTQESRGMVITLSSSALFASSKDALLPGAEDRLGQVADALKAQGDHEIVVEGHTDSQGSAGSNQGLSDRRARSVASFLISRGVPGDQIRTEGLGPTRPIADNGSAEGRANNRRVEIIVTPGEIH